MHTGDPRTDPVRAERSNFQELGMDRELDLVRGDPEQEKSWRILQLKRARQHKDAVAAVSKASSSKSG